MPWRFIESIEGGSMSPTSFLSFFLSFFFLFFSSDRPVLEAKESTLGKKKSVSVRTCIPFIPKPDK